MQNNRQIQNQQSAGKAPGLDIETLIKGAESLAAGRSIGMSDDEIMALLVAKNQDRLR